METTIYPEINTPDSDRGAASAVVRAYCGWHVTPSIQETLVLDGSGNNRLMLPTKHLTDVHSVFVNGVECSTYSWSADGWLTYYGGHFPEGDRAVTVTITHGYDYAPNVAKVVDKLVQRAAMSPAGNITQQRAGTQAVSYATANGETASDLTLLQSEKAALAPYRLQSGW